MRSDQNVRILLLRPFWDANITADFIREIHAYTRYFGRLVAIRNGQEPLLLRLDPADNPWSDKYGAVAGWLYNRFNPALNVELISATDETWQSRVIEQIGIADLIILHLAPRLDPDQRSFTSVDKPTRVISQADILNPAELLSDTREAGTGQGLLRELDYCHQSNALGKTVVLVPRTFQSQLTQARQKAGIGHGLLAYKQLDNDQMSVLPTISMADQALRHLDKVAALIYYERIGSPVFGGRFLRTINEYFQAMPLKGIGQSLLTGIPLEPIHLPPDDQLKHIRFTPIERLTKIPRGTIVELSFEEVRQLYPKAGTCPSCGSEPKHIFWYQHGLEPKLEAGSDVYLMCQYCGQKDWLV